MSKAGKSAYRASKRYDRVTARASKRFDRATANASKKFEKASSDFGDLMLEARGDSAQLTGRARRSSQVKAGRRALKIARAALKKKAAEASREVLPVVAQASSSGSEAAGQLRSLGQSVASSLAESTPAAKGRRNNRRRRRASIMFGVFCGIAGVVFSIVSRKRSRAAQDAWPPEPTAVVEPPVSLAPPAEVTSSITTEVPADAQDAELMAERALDQANDSVPEVVTEGDAVSEPVPFEPDVDPATTHGVAHDAPAVGEQPNADEEPFDDGIPSDFEGNLPGDDADEAAEKLETAVSDDKPTTKQKPKPKA